MVRQGLLVMVTQGMLVLEKPKDSVELCWDGSTCMLIYINKSISNLLKTYVHSSSLLSYVFLASTCSNGGEIHEDKLDLPAHFTERSAAATSQAKWNH
jgi:hypothetical protein